MILKNFVWIFYLTSYTCQQLFLNLVKDDASFSPEVEVIERTTNSSEISCSLSCLNVEQCCFIQIKKVFDGFVCYLFGQVSIETMGVIYENRSSIFKVQNEKRCKICQDCLEWFKEGFQKDGVYNININGTTTKKVFCDMTANGGGWTGQ